MKKKNSAWTAKDFRILAEILREIRPNPRNSDIKWGAVVNLVASSLESRFPKFDRQKFNSAVTEDK